MSVNITIVDANDNAPQFDQVRYSAEIPANVTIDAPVIRVTASDADAGDNAKIVYRLTKVKCNSKRELVFAMQTKFWYLCHLPGNTRPIWKRFFAFFNSSVGPLGSGHIK